MSQSNFRAWNWEYYHIIKIKLITEHNCEFPQCDCPRYANQAEPECKFSEYQSTASEDSSLSECRVLKKFQRFKEMYCSHFQCQTSKNKCSIFHVSIFAFVCFIQNKLQSYSHYILGSNFQMYTVYN